MPATLIDGRALAAAARAQVATRVQVCRSAGRTVRLDALLVESGDNAARVYAENQRRTCESLGIDYQLHLLPGDSGFDDIARRVDALNADACVHALMIHMPLPADVDADRIKALIDPAKDVEGVNPANIGNVVYGKSELAPCTAVATLRLIESTGTELRGKRCVVVGASATVGRPLAVLLMQREATVVSCNKYTRDLHDLCRSADVLIPAAGVPGLVGKDMVRPGALVVDVGVNRVTGPDGSRQTVGDCDFQGVSEVAGWISPVPGGVGPMTVAVLLGNVVDFAERWCPDRAGLDARITAPHGGRTGD